MSLNIVILAAGQGKRMCSTLPKVLHRLAGKTLLEHVVEKAYQLHPTETPIVVYGHQGKMVRDTLTHLKVKWVEQREQWGTGHALSQALPFLSDANEKNRVLILYGDVPLISVRTLQHFLAATPANALGIITAKMANPSGLGRIIRNAKNEIIDIIEESDADPIQKMIPEINSGIYLVPVHLLKKWLPHLEKNNAQQEYYLPTIVRMAVQESSVIHGEYTTCHEEIAGVNDRAQLSALERYYQRTLAENIMRQGVTLYDPLRLDIRGELTVGQDVVMDINVIIEGKVKIGNHCVIGANTVLRNVTLGDYAEIKSHSVIDGADIANHTVIGPFARIRPDTIIGAHAHIGNFVEIKKSRIQDYTKINHLSYIGDSEIGKRVNIGAGTITCNYDGVKKHRTIIGDDVFIGSDSQLVAPVEIGEGATIGAGSTITRNAPPNQLTLSRTQQRNIENWKKPEGGEN